MAVLRELAEDLREACKTPGMRKRSKGRGRGLARGGGRGPMGSPGGPGRRRRDDDDLDEEVSQSESAEWAEKLAKVVAKKLGGKTHGPRVLGTVEFGKGPSYVAIIASPAGRERDSIGFKALWYGKGSYRKGHGFVTHGRQFYNGFDTDGSVAQIASKLVNAMKKSTMYQHTPNP